MAAGRQSPACILVTRRRLVDDRLCPAESRRPVRSVGCCRRSKGSKRWRWVIDYEALGHRLQGLATYRLTHLSGDEKGESQVFLERLFQAFGHAGYAEAGAKLEMRIKSRDTRGTSFADLVWKPRVLVEMKKAGTDLGRHYTQAFDYWLRAVPDRPRYVVLCNFDEFWVYDFDHQLDEPVDRVALTDLHRRWEVFGFMLPDELPAQFSNDLVGVTRESAARLAALFNTLIARGVERDVAQKFVLQSVMAMFSEDIRLLPTRMFTAAVADARQGVGNAYDLLFGLFHAMNTPAQPPGAASLGLLTSTVGFTPPSHPSTSSPPSSKAWPRPAAPTGPWSAPRSSARSSSKAWTATNDTPTALTSPAPPTSPRSSAPASLTRGGSGSRKPRP